MIAISRWASRHRSSSIACIISLKLLLFVLATYAGILLSSIGYSAPGLTPVLGLILIFVAALLYPTTQRHYGKRKLLDFLIGLFAFISLASCINRIDSRHSNVYAANTYSDIFTKKKTPTAKEILESLKYRDKSSLTRQEKRILKKEFKAQLKKFAIATFTGQQPTANDSIKVILTIIAALGLLYLLAALVCNLSCNGADVAAVIVGVLGLAGIIWGSIAIIRSINRKRERSASPR